jgi:hypothetical protein
LAALLRDEEYGPKLARLGRADERRILDLVYDNRGREARRELNILDAKRREKRTLGGKARAYARLSPKDYADWRNAMDDANENQSMFWSLYKAAVLAGA